MALTVEDGTGVAGADSYVTIAAIDAYWANRPHTSEATTWTAATTANKEGAAREASAYIDATYGQHFKGQRSGYVQGLMWPRTGAEDAAGYPLPPLPPEIVTAACELAARAVSARLAEDVDQKATIKRFKEKTGPLEEETEYFEGASSKKGFGFVEGLLASILDGSQPNAGVGWHWR